MSGVVFFQGHLGSLAEFSPCNGSSFLGGCWLEVTLRGHSPSLTTCLSQPGRLLFQSHQKLWPLRLSSNCSSDKVIVQWVDLPSEQEVAEATVKSVSFPKARRCFRKYFQDSFQPEKIEGSMRNLIPWCSPWETKRLGHRHWYWMSQVLCLCLTYCHFGVRRRSRYSLLSSFFSKEWWYLLFYLSYLRSPQP